MPNVKSPARSRRSTPRKSSPRSSEPRAAGAAKLTLAEAAAEFGCTVAALQARIRRGTLLARKVRREGRWIHLVTRRELERKLGGKAPRSSGRNSQRRAAAPRNTAPAPAPAQALPADRELDSRSVVEAMDVVEAMEVVEALSVVESINVVEAIAAVEGLEDPRGASTPRSPSPAPAAVPSSTVRPRGPWQRFVDALWSLLG